MKRLRLISVRVQPVLVVDDGETLTPFPNNASEIMAADIDKFPELLRADIAVTEKGLNAEADETITIHSDFGRPDPSKIVLDEGNASK